MCCALRGSTTRCRPRAHFLSLRVLFAICRAVTWHICQGTAWRTCMWSLTTNCTDCPANPAARKRRHRAQSWAAGARTPRRMDDDNKLQFPSLPATKEDLLVSFARQPCASRHVYVLLVSARLIWANLSCLIVRPATIKRSVRVFPGRDFKTSKMQMCLNSLVSVSGWVCVQWISFMAFR